MPLTQVPLNMLDPSSGDLGFRNKLINGAFDLWQRGTSFASANGVYTADRWAGNNVTGAVSRQTFTLGQTAVPGNPKYYIQFASTGANDGIRQRIEGVQTLAGGNGTLGFYARVTAGTLSVTPRYTQVFGTGGSPSANVSTDGSAKTLTTTWQLFTDTVALPSISGKTLGTNGDDYLQVSLSCGAAATVEVALVQFEAGSVATPFEFKPLGTELALCQRYYWRIAQSNAGDTFAVGHCSSTTNMQAVIFPPESMRAKPTIETTGTAANYRATVGATNTACSVVPSLDSTFSTDALVVNFTVASGLTAGQAGAIRAAATNAYLGFAAEL